MAKPFDISKFRKSLTKSIDGIGVGFNDPTDWISTGCYALNYLISGDFNKGVPLGKVTVLGGQSGCLPKDSQVRIRYQSKTTQYYNEKTVTVSDLRVMFMHKNYDIEIHTPDGWQPITDWFDKGIMNIVSLKTKSHTTRCATNHLIECVVNDEIVWIPAVHIQKDQLVVTQSGHEPVLDTHALYPEECYDFTVNHPNHRYWGDGFSSHNSGKSYICSGNIVKNAQEQGIYVVLIDTENALDETWLKNLGVDTSEDKLLKLNMAMIDDVAKTISEFMSEYKTLTDAPKVLFVIDSLGMLLTPTDSDQFSRGELKGDMGKKPKALTALVRNCVNMFGSYNVGMICTNHSYASQNIFDPDDVMSGGCLTAGHKVWMADGSAKNIEDIVIGDVVVTLNGDIDVSKTFIHDDKEVFELVLESGEILQATGEHKFLTSDEQGGLIWKTVDELNENDEILQVI